MREHWIFFRSVICLKKENTSPEKLKNQLSGGVFIVEKLRIRYNIKLSKLDSSNVLALVSMAEKDMYADKESYYERHGLNRRRT